MSGYAVECGLKACFLAREYNEGVIFREKTKPEAYRTHDLKQLISVAGLVKDHEYEQNTNANFKSFWVVVSAWSLLIQLARDGYDVRGAAWISVDDERPWTLYMVTSAVDTLGVHAAYLELFKSLPKKPRLANSLSEIRIVSPSSSVGAELVDMARRYNQEIWSGGPLLGGMAIDWALIYPPVIRPAVGGIPMTQDEVRKKVLDLLDRTGLVQPSTIVLQDGTRFVGVPCGVDINNRVMTVKIMEDQSPIQRVIPVSAIASIA